MVLATASPQMISILDLFGFGTNGDVAAGSELSGN
jgi:hypothetical protein